MMDKNFKIHQRWANKRVSNIAHMIERMRKDEVFFLKTASNMVREYSGIPHTAGDDAFAQMLDYIANRLSSMALAKSIKVPRIVIPGPKKKKTRKR